MIVRFIHLTNGHAGKNTVTAISRQKYWIVHVGVIVTQLCRNCVTCQRLHGKLLQQRMADLPVDRVVPGDGAWSVVGIDVFGPIVVIVHRRPVKRWGCIFSCLHVRCCHLEKLDSLDSDSLASVGPIMGPI